MDDHRSRLGRLLREARLALDPPCTQEALAALLDVKQPAVSAWESGKAVPSITTLHRLSLALHLDADELLETAGLAASKVAS